MTATTTQKRMNPVVLGILALAVVLAAFFMGQRTARTPGQAAVVATEADHEEHAGEGHGEEGGAEEGISAR